MALKMLTMRQFASRSKIDINCSIDNLAKTHNQVRYVKMLKKDNVKVVLVSGVAGTGKTLIGCSYAISGLINKQIEKVIITRPTISMNEEYGFLPGKIDEKLHNWLIPIYDSFSSVIPSTKVKEFIQQGKIEIAPLGFIRGRTFHNSCIFVDEAQNIDCIQMKTLLTRIGYKSKMIIVGDPEQCDLKQQPNGMVDFINRLSVYPDDNYSIQHIELTEEDIMRSDVVKKVLDIYNYKSNKLE